MTIDDVSGQTIQELISLAGRVAVVTGGGQGIGFAIARRLAEAGADLVIADLDGGAAEKAAFEISSRYGHRAFGAQVDVCDEHAVESLADKAISELGGLQIWVNNAGIYPVTRLLDLSVQQWTMVVDVNLKGAFLGAREAARRMIAARDSGVIINLASVAAYRANSTGGTEYVSAKHGVRGLTKSLAAQLGPHGIRVLALAPTTIDTPGIRQSRHDVQAAGNDAIDRNIERPLGRDGVADDVARVALFCASDLSMLMTGSTLLVDGGTLALL